MSYSVDVRMETRKDAQAYRLFVNDLSTGPCRSLGIFARPRPQCRYAGEMSRLLRLLRRAMPWLGWAAFLVTLYVFINFWRLNEVAPCNLPLDMRVSQYGNSVTARGTWQGVNLAIPFNTCQLEANLREGEVTEVFAGVVMGVLYLDVEHYTIQSVEDGVITASTTFNNRYNGILPAESGEVRLIIDVPHKVVTSTRIGSIPENSLLVTLRDGAVAQADLEKDVALWPLDKRFAASSESLKRMCDEIRRRTPETASTAVK